MLRDKDSRSSRRSRPLRRSRLVPRLHPPQIIPTPISRCRGTLITFVPSRNSTKRFATFVFPWCRVVPIPIPVSLVGRPVGLPRIGVVTIRTTSTVSISMTVIVPPRASRSRPRIFSPAPSIPSGYIIPRPTRTPTNSGRGSPGSTSIVQPIQGVSATAERAYCPGSCMPSTGST